MLDVKFPAVRVRLSGRDGNAFSIMGCVGAALKKAGATAEEVQQFYREAMGGDYHALLRVCSRWVTVS